MKPNPLPFIREKWHGVAKPSTSFAGKTVLVTGASTGLGFEAAATFAELEARVILAVRNTVKGETARYKIQARTQNRNLEVWELEMASYASILNFVSRVEMVLPRVDVVILNAGIVVNDYTTSAEGWESMLQINVLSTALLGLLLLPRLEASKSTEDDAPHLVIVTSEAHRWLEASDLPDPSEHGGSILSALNAKPIDGKKWDPFLQHATTKLLALYISRSIADLSNQRNSDLGPIVTAVCPGACKSELMHDLMGRSISQTIQLTLFDNLFNKSTQEGGWTYVYASMLEREGHGGWYKTTLLTT